MSSTTPVVPQHSGRATPFQSNAPAASEIRELLTLAVRGLEPMFAKDKQLFCHRVLSTKQGLVQEGLSPRYTVMTVLGLKELEATGVPSPFEIPSIYAALTSDQRWIQGVGDLGLLIWLTAVFDPEHTESLLHAYECETALDRFRDAREARTMELAWFLTGLAYAAEACPQLKGKLTDLAAKTYRRLLENRGTHGYFGHMGKNRSLIGRLRGHIGSFADQAYPTFAMSKYAKAFQLEEPLGPALQCAAAISAAQGKLGQWWWLYDVRSGRVSSRYPVYAVHQHGMAPMCLLAVEQATGQSFRDSLNLGLRWIFGQNELGAEMRDLGQGLIWRCILPASRRTKFREMLTSVFRPIDKEAQVNSLKILFEQRPYEYGWLLYALCRYAQA